MSPARLEELCEVMHDAYEAAAAEAGWETQAASRKPWSEVPEANKAAMRAGLRAVSPRISADAWRSASELIATMAGTLSDLADFHARAALADTTEGGEKP